MNEETTPKPPNKLRRILLAAGGAVLAIVLVAGAYAGYTYASSPAIIRKPQIEHYHFRMQILVNGTAQNFASKDYQTGYSKDQCNASLPDQPIHFHDNKDQFVHIHWEGMTGGLVLKYYGWNYVGGLRGALGYRFDNLRHIQKVPTHGNYLPAVPAGASFYVYTGDEKGYKQKSFDDFKRQDLEQFFGKTSNLPAHELNHQKSSLLDTLFPRAYAHGAEVHSAATGDEDEKARLTRINNLIGNVVIFVQKGQPTDQQIKARFAMLAPLSESTCGG